MTAIKPCESRLVKGVASERYPLNQKCSHPECGEEAVDPHHAFPRSQIIGDSYFVQFFDENGHTLGDPTPHVTGLCRAHHDDVEQHRAWIKLEDGWSWYERAGEPPASEDYRPLDAYDATWTLLGPLNPQPGSREGKPKRKKFKGEERRKRTTISVRVPQDAVEDGGEVYDTLLEQCQEKLQKQLDVTYTPTPYIALIAVMHAYLTQEVNQGVK